MTPPGITRRYCNWRAVGDTAKIAAEDRPVAGADRFYTVSFSSLRLAGASYRIFTMKGHEDP
ncbi:MAG TPA: hypothetical protein PKW63_16495 [Vicinamibacterales bacterium]|nr:hypothetical protein [Acidobacteriota bacterium]HQX83367.1 hypothetical protein [Vicinamibacterales bacterium]